jgi:hypothetical protein
MPLSFLRFLPAALLLSVPLLTRAEPADDAVDAVLQLRKQNGYAWEVSTSKGGVAGQPKLPRTKRGSVNAAGDIYLEQVWPDGLVLETVIRRDGAVVHTPDGWFTRNELSDISRQAKRSTPRSPWLSLALASLDSLTPEEELTRMLNDAKDYERDGDKIDAVLTERGATYWLGSARLIPNATGEVHIRLRNGLIRECRIVAEGEKPAGAVAGHTSTTHVEFETTITFDYSGGATVIPYEAKQKLKQASDER